MNKWSLFGIHVLGLIATMAVFYVIGSGNWVFDDLYLWSPNLQPIFIVAFMFGYPYYVRYTIRLLTKR